MPWLIYFSDYSLSCDKNELNDEMIIWASTRENLSSGGGGGGGANNTGTDQTVHSRSLISAFVIRFLKSIICKLATGEISIF